MVVNFQRKMTVAVPPISAPAKRNKRRQYSKPGKRVPDRGHYSPGSRFRRFVFKAQTMKATPTTTMKVE